jgi:hypothetical protein
MVQHSLSSAVPAGNNAASGTIAHSTVSPRPAIYVTQYVLLQWNAVAVTHDVRRNFDYFADSGCVNIRNNSQNLPHTASALARF